jgi:hypothetical protein
MRFTTGTTGIAIAMCFAAMPIAAGQQTAPTRPAATAAPATRDGDVVIVGCLMRTDRSANRPGTSYSSTNGEGRGPALANGGAGSGFVLKDAAVATHAEPASATPGAAHAARGGFQEFRVIAPNDANAKLNLAEHVNTQVEVRGRLVVPEAPDSAAGGAGAVAGPRLNIGANAVTVTAIRTLAPTCPPAG